MGQGFGKWKHSPEMWSELGPHSTSFLCPVPRKEIWLVWECSGPVLGTRASQRQAWNRRSSCPPYFIQNIPRKKRERKDPDLSLLPRQGNGRHSKLPFSSLRHEGSRASAATPSTRRRGGTALPQLRKSLGDPPGVPSFATPKADDHGPSTAAGVSLQLSATSGGSVPLATAAPSEHRVHSMPSLVPSAESVAALC